MRSIARLFVACGLWAGVLPGPVQAQQLAMDRALFVGQCSRCHGLPPSLLHGADSAAGQPIAIAAALARVRAMNSLRERISEQDMRDIAAFLAKPDAQPHPASDEVERLFTWAEWRHQTLLHPRTDTVSLAGYRVRHYRAPGLYVGVANGQVWLHEEASPERGIRSLGDLRQFLEQARNDGF